MNIKTSEQFRSARMALGLSYPEAGRLLNVNPDTVRKWEAGGRRTGSLPPNPVACRVFEMLMDDKLIDPKARAAIIAWGTTK